MTKSNPGIIFYDLSCPGSNLYYWLIKVCTFENKWIFLLVICNLINSLTMLENCSRCFGNIIILNQFEQNFAEKIFSFNWITPILRRLSPILLVPVQCIQCRLNAFNTIQCSFSAMHAKAFNANPSIFYYYKKQNYALVSHL